VAATIVSGAAPLLAAEADHMIDENRIEWYLIRGGDRAGVEAALRPEWEQFLADSRTGFAQILDSSSPKDRAAFENHLATAGVLDAIALANRRSLSTEENFQAWIDESFALVMPWDDIDVESITTSITWYHGRQDTAAPFSAAERLVGALQSASLVELGKRAGHFSGVVGEGARLDELLAR
jgi:pimeloyl-ACP methyl ester carboxylesterase